MGFIKEKIVILSGGLATRLRPVTEKIPKSLLDISGKPFISHQLELIKSRGINKVVICAGYLGEKIREVVKNGESFGLKIEYSFDGDKLLGTGGAIKKALSLLSETFFVMYGDSYLNMEYSEVMNYFNSVNYLGLMTVLKNKDKWDKSNVWFDDNKIKLYDKKNKIDKMHHIDYGLGILKKSVFQNHFIDDECFDLELVYKTLINENQLAGYEVSERFYEIGSPKGLMETRKYFLNHQI